MIARRAGSRLDLGQTLDTRRSFSAASDILQGYGPEQLRYGTGGPKQVENLYTEALLRQSFVSLEILHLASHESVVHEGVGHDGMAALLDLVARKSTPNLR